jgi:NitT/TauT family transport system substrate-binding protein
MEFSTDVVRPDRRPRRTAVGVLGAVVLVVAAISSACGGEEAVQVPAAVPGEVTSIDSAEGSAIIDEALEKRRLRLAIQGSIATADARAEGFGDIRPPRLALMASQVADAFATKDRINPDRIWNGSFLPTAAERNILGK